MKKEKKEISHLNRKPDTETESLRIWKLNKDEEKHDKVKNYSKNSFKIDLKTGKITKKKDGLCFVDFKILKDKSKILTAYKIKHDENHILFYINPMLSESEYQKIHNTYNIFRVMGLQVTDIIKDMLPSVRAEVKIMADKKEKVIIE